MAYEAQAAGLPVVASRVGGIPEILEEGKTGFLVPPGDSGVMAETLLRLLENEVLRSKMGKAGMERATRFSWEAMVREILDVYREFGVSE